MERPRRQKRVYYTAGLWNRAPVLAGAVLFLIAQALWLIQLFQDASSRSAAGQAPPEGFTPAGIVGRSLILLEILFLSVLLIRQRRGTARLSRPRRYLLMSALTAAWGLIHIVLKIRDIFVYPEFILFLDILMLAAALVAPVVQLQLADFRREPPDVMVLLFTGVGGAAFSVISLLIYALVLKKSYSTFFRLAPELMFRLACCLFGTADLLSALKLRKDAPFAAPVSRAEPEEWAAANDGTGRRSRAGNAPEDRLEADGGWLSGFDAQTAAADPGEPEAERYAPPSREAPRSPGSPSMSSPSASLLNAARRQLSLPEEPERQAAAGYDTGRTGPGRIPAEKETTGRMNSPRIRQERADTDPGEAPPPPARPPRPRGGQGTGAAAKEISGEAALTRWQSQRLHRVNEFEEERWQRQQLERPPIAHPYADAQVRRISCPDCGKRVPEDFPVCPRCGRPL